MWKPDSWRGLRTPSGGADGLEPDPDDLLEEMLAVGGQDALDDAPVVLAMPPFDQAMALDAVDEAGGRRRAEFEDVGDRAHRLRAGAEQQSSRSCPRVRSRTSGGGTTRGMPRKTLRRSTATAVRRGSAGIGSGTRE